MRHKAFVLLTALILLSVFPGAAQSRQDALKLYHQGDYEESVAICLKELSEFSDDQIIPRMDAYTVLGWSLIRLKRYEQAIEYGEQALAFYSSDGRIIENLGEAHYHLEHYQQSLEYFQSYISLYPAGERIAQVYYYMGEIYIRLNMYHHGDIALSTALHYLPSKALWCFRLGYARERAGNLHSAVSAYNQALRLQPGFLEAQKGLERIQNKD